jgi:Restriction endonuclease
MLILGKNSDDKGTQLEKLTLALLVARGYRNLSISVIGSGGEERDVEGEYDAPLMASRKVFKLICECKAYKSVVSLPEWLKFCGKLYVARQTSRVEAHGCFIALSGVNGNVRGIYAELKEHEANIELVTGDDLLALVREVYPLLDLKAVLERTKKATDRVITESDVAYYDGQVYWLLMFEGETYTVLKADGKLLSAEEAAALRPMVETQKPAAKYVNLQEEAQAKERAYAAETAVLSSP